MRREVALRRLTALRYRVDNLADDTDGPDTRDICECLDRCVTDIDTVLRKGDYDYDAVQRAVTEHFARAAESMLSVLSA